MRPSDWFLVDLGGDPTPGDAFGIRSLASKYSDIAQIAGEASTGVRHARSSGASSAWVGDAADVFRDKSERMPGELAKANDSYELVAEALRTWAASVDDTQAQADRGLQQAREAHADLSNAQAALSSAEWSWTTAHAQQLTYQTLTKAYTIVPPPPGVTMPTDYQLRNVDRSAQQAQASMASARQTIADADARLAAARALVHEAKERRDEAERVAVHQIARAGDHAVKPSSIWEAIQDSAAWQAVVVIATVVLTIITIVAIFVGGPLVWALIIAATVLLMVNALMSIAQGKDAWGELIMLGIGLIPGGRLLGLAAKGVEALARTGEAGLRIANGIRSVTGVVSRVGSMVTERVTTVLSSLERSAMAAFPRVTTLVERSAVAAHSALDSFFNPSWLSHFHPGGGVDAVSVAARHADQAGGFSSDASHATGGSSRFETPAGGHVDAPGGGYGDNVAAGAAHDGAPGAAHADAPSAGGQDAAPAGSHEGAGVPSGGAGSHDLGAGGTSAPGGGGGGGDGATGAGGSAPKPVWEEVHAHEDLGPSNPDVITAAHASQTAGSYNHDNFLVGQLHEGDRIEMGYNGHLIDHLHPDNPTPGTHGVEAPGHSAYSGYAYREGTAASSNFEKIQLWMSGQVREGTQGFRDELIRFQASTDIDIAHGIAQHNGPFIDNGVMNPGLGPGGAHQVFIPDFIKAVHRGDLIPIDAHGNPIPFQVFRKVGSDELNIQFFATRPQHLIHLH